MKSRSSPGALAQDDYRTLEEAVATAAEIVLARHGIDPGISTPARNIWD